MEPTTTNFKITFKFEAEFPDITAASVYAMKIAEMTEGKIEVIKVEEKKKKSKE